MPADTALRPRPEPRSCRGAAVTTARPAPVPAGRSVTAGRAEWQLQSRKQTGCRWHRESKHHKSEEVGGCRTRAGEALAAAPTQACFLSKQQPNCPGAPAVPRQSQGRSHPGPPALPHLPWSLPWGVVGARGGVSAQPPLGLTFLQQPRPQHPPRGHRGDGWMLPCLATGCLEQGEPGPGQGHQGTRRARPMAPALLGPSCRALTACLAQGPAQLALLSQKGFPCRKLESLRSR